MFSFIEAAHPAIALIVFLASFYLLVKSSDILVDQSAAIAKIFHVPDLIVGLTILAIGTSLPEVAVSVFSAMEGRGSIALGNVAGSNIFNSGIILGLMCMFRSCIVPREIRSHIGPIYIVASAMLLVVCLNYEVGRAEGIVMLTGLVAYILSLIYRAKHSVKQKKAWMAENAIEDEKPRFSTISLKGILILISLALMAFSSKTLISSAVNIGSWAGMSEWLIGITIIAGGTSLPELMTTISSIKKGKGDMGIGNLLGSDILNIFGAIGLAGVVSGFSVSATHDVISVGLMLAMNIVIFVMLWKVPILGRKSGAAFIAMAMARYLFDSL